MMESLRLNLAMSELENFIMPCKCQTCWLTNLQNFGESNTTLYSSNGFTGIWNHTKIQLKAMWICCIAQHVPGTGQSMVLLWYPLIFSQDTSPCCKSLTMTSHVLHSYLMPIAFLNSQSYDGLGDERIRSHCWGVHQWPWTVHSYDVGKKSDSWNINPRSKSFCEYWLPPVLRPSG